MTLAWSLREARVLGAEVEDRTRSCHTSGPSSGFPKSDFGQHRPRRVCWGRLGIRVARSTQLSGRSGR